MKRCAVACLALVALAVAGCGGSGQSIAPGVEHVTLAAATASVCVPAQSTPQTVQVPDTGGVTAVLGFATYDVGTTGCQNVTIATGADASAVAANASLRRVAAATSSSPLFTITLGAGLPASSSTVFSLTTVLSGVTLTTDPNVVFPDGTYNATITLVQLGTSITYSLVFTASGGKLTLTGGNALPLTLGSGAVIAVFDRGVVPPGFELPTASPSPAASGTASAGPSASPAPTASASPVATATPVPSASPTTAGVPPDGTTIGTETCSACGPGGQPYTAPIVYEASSPEFQTSQIPASTTYVINGLPIKSYRVDGCTGLVGYSGTGVQGVFSAPGGAYTAADSCEIDLFSVDASVVNAAPNHGFAYDVYAALGPVAQIDALTYQYPPAVDVP